jgi:hypothetical protein
MRGWMSGGSERTFDNISTNVGFRRKQAFTKKNHKAL